MGHGALALGAVLAVGVAAENVRVPHPEDFVNVLAGTVGGQRDGMHHSSGRRLRSGGAGKFTEMEVQYPKMDG